MKAAKVFTRENPCTKIDLHNAFWLGGRYADQPVVRAKQIIGDNAPKYMLKKGYIEQTLRDGVDWYIVTDEGRTWLSEGLARHLELHPEQAHLVARGTAQTPRRRIIRSGGA